MSVNACEFVCNVWCMQLNVDLAHILNEDAVRRHLANKGHVIPEDTWFVVEDGKQCYYFPMYLLENQQNNFWRVKNTMRMLCARGWNARQMQ